MRKFLFLLVTMLSTTAHANAPLVFIHGIKGSKLAAPGGKIHWLTSLQALGFSAPDLALPLEWEGDRQKTDDLTPAGILDSVAFSSIYGPWLEAAAGFGVPFHPFSYDWRRDPLENVDRFEKFLEGLGPKRIRVVAHSMGGLITMAVLNRRPELFSSVVFVGVPFPGGIGFLPDLHEGTSTGLNGRILAPEVLATFPSVYCLFPLNFLTVETWKSQQIGPFKPGRTVPDGFEGFFAKALERVKRFRGQLAAKQDKYPPILVVNGRAHPTLARAIQKDGKWDFESAPKEPGDGRVLEAHSLPPSPILHELFSSKAEHSELLNDPLVIERIKKFP